MGSVLHYLGKRATWSFQNSPWWKLMGSTRRVGSREVREGLLPDPWSHLALLEGNVGPALRGLFVTGLHISR